MLEAPWLLWLAVATALFWVGESAWLLLGLRRMSALRDEAAVPDEECPPASVCVAARNEEAEIERAVASQLAQDYPELEVVAVDDRSTDATGEILEGLAAGDDRLRVIHLEELPDGWTGKPHALHRAAEAATGRLFLFTDADVVMEPEALRRATGRMRRRRLDHLTLAPECRWRGAFLRAVGSMVLLALLDRLRPWKAADPESRTHVGIGAFNLVRREAYRRAGGHRSIRAALVDDMALARRLRRAGARSECLWGHGLVRLAWYRNLGDLARGVGRSTIADFGYSAGLAALVTCLLLLLNVWPWAGVGLTAGAARWANLAAVLAMAGLFLATRRLTGGRAVDALLWPVASLVLAWSLLRAALLLRLKGGVAWRGTFYPLEVLREGRWQGTSSTDAGG